MSLWGIGERYMEWYSTGDVTAPAQEVKQYTKHMHTQIDAGEDERYLRF